jgi:hypothetical protein
MWETLVAVGKSGGWCLQKFPQVAIEKSHHFQDHVQIQLWLNSRKKSCSTSPPPSTTTSLLHASLSLMMPSPTIPLSTQQHFHFKTSHAVNTHAPTEGKLLPLATSSSLMAFDLAHNGCRHTHHAVIPMDLDAPPRPCVHTPAPAGGVYTLMPDGCPRVCILTTPAHTLPLSQILSVSSLFFSSSP